MRKLIFFLASVAISFPASAVGPSNTPRRQWTVNFAPTSCEIIRHRVNGQNGVLIQLRPHTRWHGITFIVPPIHGRVFGESVSLSLPEDDPAYRPTALVGNSPDAQHGLIGTQLTEGQLASAQNTKSASVRGKRIGTVSVDTDGLPNAVKGAQACLDDLARRWGAPRTWATDPVAERDVRSLFRASDFPSAMLVARQRGSARALLGIGANGRVASCRAIETEGPRAFAERVCEVLTNRARFAPARDEDGKVAHAFVLAPPVRFELR